MSSADDQYEQNNDQVTGDVPTGDNLDNDYTSRTGQKNASVPVQKDTDAVVDPIDPATADSDESLGTLSFHCCLRATIERTCSRLRMSFLTVR